MSYGHLVRIPVRDILKGKWHYTRMCNMYICMCIYVYMYMYMYTYSFMYMYIQLYIA